MQNIIAKIKQIKAFKIVISNFPKSFALKFKATLITTSDVLCRIKSRFIVKEINTFVSNVKTNVKIRIPIKSSFFNSSKIKGRVKQRMKIKSDENKLKERFFLRTKSRIAEVSSKIKMISKCKINQAIFKKYSDYSDNLTWEDIDDDMTLEEFIVTYIE